MAPGPGSRDRGFKDGKSLAGPRPTRPLCCPHIPAAPIDPIASPAPSGPRAGPGFRAALGSICSGGCTVQKPPAASCCWHGDGAPLLRRPPGPKTFLPASIFFCGFPAPTSSSQSQSPGFPAVTEPKWRIPVGSRLGRLLRRHKGKTTPGGTPPTCRVTSAKSRSPFPPLHKTEPPPSRGIV